MKYFIFLILFSPLLCFSQKSAYKGFPSVVWPKLYDVSFVNASGPDGDYEKPVFSEGAKSLQDKVVTLPGYMVPFEAGTKSSHFMLTSLPLNACFFCGVGGPETVIEVFTKTDVPYKDKPVEVRGKLKLNPDDPDKMMYILQDAEIIGEAGF